MTSSETGIYVPPSAHPLRNAAPFFERSGLWLCAATLTLAGLAMRLAAFNQRELWLDETWTGAAALSETLHKLFLNWVLPDVHPPIFPLFVWAWVKLFGASDAALRVPSLLAAIATPLAGIFGCRAILGEREAWTAGTLLATSSMLIQSADWARAYSLLILACLLTSLMAFRSALNQAPRWASFVAAGLLACYLHYFGALLIAGLCICLFGLEMARGRLVLGPFLLLTAGFLPWVAVHTHSLLAMSGGKFWIEPASFGDSLWMATLATFGGTPWEMLLLLLPLPALLLLGKRLQQAEIVALGMVVLVISIDLVVSVASQHTPLVAPRYFLAFLPTVLLAISVIAARLPTMLLTAWLAIYGSTSLLIEANNLFSAPNIYYPAWEHHSVFLARGEVRSLVFYLDDPLNRQLDAVQLEDLGRFFFQRSGRDLPVAVISLRPGAPNRVAIASLPRPVGIIKVSAGLTSYKDDTDWLSKFAEHERDLVCDAASLRSKSIACIVR